MIVLAGRNVHADFRDLRNLLYLLIGSGTAVFALGLLGGWSLSGATVRPIAEITRVASDLSETNLSDRSGRNRCRAAEAGENAERDFRPVAVGVQSAGAVYGRRVS